MGDRKCPATGQLAQPIIIRGNPPPRWYPPPHTRWQAAINLGLANPAWWDEDNQEWVGGWMLVAQIKHGGWKERSYRIKLDKGSLHRWLLERRPYEKWQLALGTGEGWVRNLYMRFLYVMTPEEYVLDKKRRREIYDNIQARGRELKAERELEARLRAEKMERRKAARFGANWKGIKPAEGAKE